jgi:two-component system, OmpR family, KDP operon response regulator KdpE
MNNKPLILIVEDDKTISNFISAILEANDYRVLLAAKAQDALSMAVSYCPDLILLDLGLPDLDGIEVLKRVRQWTGLPVIIVSARGHETEKVEALDLGADDYLTKPFGSAELLARIRTALRHSEGQARGTQSPIEPLKVGDLEIDYTRRVVSINEELIHLTPIEYKIVVLLSKNLGKVLTYDAIMREVWGPYINERQALRVNMANIRRKLEANPGDPRYISTEVGVGYRMIDLIK